MALSQISKHANHFSQIANHSRYDSEGHCDLFVDKGLWVVKIFKVLVRNVYSEWRRICGISWEQSATVSSLKVMSFIMRKPKKWDRAKVRLCAWLRMRVWKGLVYIFHWESLPHSRLVGGKYKLLSAAISSPLLWPSSSLPPKESVDLLQRVLFGFPWLTRIAPRHRSQ